VKNNTMNMDTTTNNMQTDTGRAVSLFDGKSLSGWLGKVLHFAIKIR
jgi:hypothetical protein